MMKFKVRISFEFLSIIPYTCSPNLLVFPVLILMVGDPFSVAVKQQLSKFIFQPSISKPFQLLLSPSSKELSPFFHICMGKNQEVQQRFQEEIQ